MREEEKKHSPQNILYVHIVTKNAYLAFNGWQEYVPSMYMNTIHDIE